MQLTRFLFFYYFTLNIYPSLLNLVCLCYCL